MTDAGADGDADGYTYSAMATSRSVIAANDGFASRFTVATVGTSNSTPILFRNNTLDPLKKYTLALCANIVVGDFAVSSPADGIKFTLQVLTNASGTINSDAFQITAPGTYEIFTIVTIPAGSVRHDYAIFAQGLMAGAGTASAVVDVSNFAAVDITELIR